MDYIKFEYDQESQRYWVENSAYTAGSIGTMIYGLTELASEVVRADWAPDFEFFLFDDTAQSYGSNEVHVKKSGNKLFIYPFSGQPVTLSKKAFENLFKELKEAFALKTPLIVVLWNGQKFTVKNHE